MIVNKQSVFTGLSDPLANTGLSRYGIQLTNSDSIVTIGMLSPMVDSLNNYGQGANTDLTHISQCLNGNVRFGNVKNLANGENISGQFVVVTTTTANVEVVVQHILNVIPTGFLVT